MPPLAPRRMRFGGSDDVDVVTARGQRAREAAEKRLDAADVRREVLENEQKSFARTLRQPAVEYTARNEKRSCRSSGVRVLFSGDLMGLVLAVATSIALGHELSLRLWRRDTGFREEPFQALLSTVTLGTTLWLSSTWALALAQWLTAPALIARSGLFALAALILYVRRRKESGAGDILTPRQALVCITATAPLVIWIVFILWRGAIVPPLTHDALSYHLPKAVLYSRAAGFDPLPFLSFNIRTLPASYEMLLADVITVDGRDRFTEWIATLFYMLIVIAAVALAERWWKPRMEGLLTMMLFAGGVPVLLLHSGAHKNDLMTGFFMAAMLVWAGRWISRGESQSLYLLAVSSAAAIGTKPQAAILAAALAPALLWRVVRDRVRPRVVVAALLLFASSAVLLGGAVYVANATAEGSAFSVSTESDGEETPMLTYGDWKNLWQAPYVLVAAPFSRDPMALAVPWARAAWFLPRYEIFFSHYGALFSMCAVALPVGIVFFRRRVPETSVERFVVTLAVAATFIAILPVRWIPAGFYPISLPRYAMFILPVVFGWTAVPLADRLAQEGRRTALALVYGGSLFAGWYAVDNAIHDRFAPLRYVIWAQQQPGTRVIPFWPNRAASVMDFIAGPRDRVAIDAGYGAWIHPVFGAALERPVHFIQPDDGVRNIPPDVQWVVVDRSWNAIWGHPEFKDLSDWNRFLARGRMQPEDLRLIRELSSDDRFERVMIDPRTAQAVFRRAH